MNDADFAYPELNPTAYVNPAEVTPGVPAGLNAAADDMEVTLTWNAAENAESYNVYVDDVLKESGITDTTYSVLNLENGREYRFAVSAVSSTNTVSAKSDEVKASPVKAEVPEVTPAAPTGLKAAAGDGQAELTWDKVENAKSYTVYQDSKAIKTGLTDTKFTVTGLTNGTKYTFTVTATMLRPISSLLRQAARSSSTPRVLRSSRRT